MSPSVERRKSISKNNARQSCTLKLTKRQAEAIKALLGKKIDGELIIEFRDDPLLSTGQAPSVLSS